MAKKARRRRAPRDADGIHVRLWVLLGAEPASNAGMEMKTR